MIHITQKVLNDLVEERNKQHAKFDEQNHTNEWWMLIVDEEAGEIAQAILHERFGGKAAGTVRTELVQLVAVGIAWLEAIDRRDAAARETVATLLMDGVIGPIDHDGMDIN